MKNFCLLISLGFFAGAAVAVDAKGGYEKSGETAGMDPVAYQSGQKLIARAPTQRPEVKPIAALPRTKPAELTGMAASEETEGMDPRQPAGQKIVRKTN